ncbi:hypothetical protein AURANDRAFT_63596 [Aureococcus anophagefferens]|uniref:CobW/HypB/UreG nucleotide-binding domain-containing protein n=1 Tax=Aureococcus anophagefferens TaxID=44056 RepID=F0Y7G8_AURAN|nr:hypothetical protein AURANDRAFT_63596 [Aureococcus anophagefferens]EGB09182.1 hypothetical protein AURANDRAFT_63596 [Aureococcus anophagefferens]|eukprot:XP_009036293.1 hypothetical protein AURANDRAFT_63596 [Aureococcus anophagefferens]
MSFVYGKGEGPTARDPFDKEWWRNVSSRQAVVKQTGSLWADQSIKRRKPKPITFPEPWAGPGLDRVPVVVVTGGLGSGKTAAARGLAARAAAEAAAGGRVRGGPVVVVTHRYWQEHGVTPPPAGGGDVRHHAVFDFGNACICCAPDGDFQALLKRLHPEGIGCVVVETTGTSDPALFARILFQDAVLLAKFALRSIVAVFDARTVEAQLAKPDRPGAKNPHRLQLLSADRVLLSHGGDCGDGGAAAAEAAAAAAGDGAVAVDVVEDLRRGGALLDDALRPALDAAAPGFAVDAVDARRPAFLGDAAYDAVRPCRFVKAMVSFAPSDGVLNAVCILEQGFVYEKQLRDLAARLGGALRGGEICRFKAAGLLRLPTGRLEGVLLDGSLDRCDEARVPVDPAAAARGPRSAFEVMDEAADDSKLGEAGDWAPDVGAPCVRLFVIGKRLNAAALRAAVRATVIPEGFVYAADEELDFGLFTDGDDAADDPLSRLIAGAPAEPKTELTVDLDGAAVTLFRRPDGGYAAKRDGNDAELEVIKMFASALYVSLPDVASLPAPPPVM